MNDPIAAVKQSKEKCRRQRDNWKAKALALQRQIDAMLATEAQAVLRLEALRPKLAEIQAKIDAIADQKDAALRALADTRAGNNELTLALAADAGIKIDCDPRLLGAVWERFRDGVLRIVKERDAKAAGLDAPKEHTP